MEDMAKLADKILVLNNGELVMFDTPKNVFSQRERLEDIGLSVPTVTKVIYELNKNGYNLPTDIITVDEAKKAILALKKGGSANDR